MSPPRGAPRGAGSPVCPSPATRWARPPTPRRSSPRNSSCTGTSPPSRSVGSSDSGAPGPPSAVAGSESSPPPRCPSHRVPRGPPWDGGRHRGRSTVPTWRPGAGPGCAWSPCIRRAGDPWTRPSGSAVSGPDPTTSWAGDPDRPAGRLTGHGDAPTTADAGGSFHPVGRFRQPVRGGRRGDPGDHVAPRRRHGRTLRPQSDHRAAGGGVAARAHRPVLRHPPDDHRPRQASSRRSATPDRTGAPSTSRSGTPGS